MSKLNGKNDQVTESRFIYYGKESRDEYRLTRFGRGFPFLTDENVGDLLVLCKIEEEYYEGFVLSTDDDREDFLASNGIDIPTINGLIPKSKASELTLEDYYQEFLRSLSEEFPSSLEISEKSARDF